MYVGTILQRHPANAQLEGRLVRMMLTRMLVNIRHNVTNMMVLQPVNRGAAMLLAVNHVRLTQDAQVMRGQRLRNTQVRVQFTINLY